MDPPHIFGDPMTADHKVLNEEKESRSQHRFAVVAQDLDCDLWGPMRGVRGAPSDGFQVP